jgi:S-adenosyl-L-methionine hydrolase (adenosine-forming)
MSGDHRPPAVYFLSDYGLVDAFVGVVHAVLHRQAPGVPVIDLTHQVPPFDVAAGAATLARSAPHLGSGVLVAVVDPGVATDRRGVALSVEAPDGPTWLVGPDNGLLLPAADHWGGPRSAVHLRADRRSTFDGRDLFAPAAARLVAGGDPAELGSQVPVDSLVPAPTSPDDHRDGDRLVTSVTWLDTFGNVQLRAGPDALDRLGVPVGGTVGVEVDGSSPTPARRVAAFGDLADGELGVLTDGDGRLSLVLDRASAAARLGLGPGSSGRPVALGHHP